MKRAGKDRVAETAVTFIGLGNLPLMPGTWATLGAALVHAAVAVQIGTSDHPYVVPALAGLCALASVCLCPWAERFYRRKDPPRFVLDEAAGYFLAVSFFPHHSQLPVGVLGVVLFRLFDIIKPPPGRQAESLPRGVGIVADDLIAGLYAALCIGIILHLF